GPIDRLLFPAPVTIVREGGRCGAAHRRELVPGVPGVRVRPVAREAAIEVVRQRLGTESQLMFRSVVRRAGDGRWLTRPRPRAVHRYPLTCIVVTVAEVPERVSAASLGHTS